MPILVYCVDEPDSAEPRQEHLRSHFDYVEGVLDEIKIAGPFRSLDDEDNTDIDGSLFIYATDDLEEAKRLFFGDPYNAQPIYKNYRFARFTPAAGTWIGGKIW